MNTPMREPLQDPPTPPEDRWQESWWIEMGETVGWILGLGLPLATGYLLLVLRVAGWRLPEEQGRTGPPPARALHHLAVLPSGAQPATEEDAMDSTAQEDPAMRTTITDPATGYPLRYEDVMTAFPYEGIAAAHASNAACFDDARDLPPSISAPLLLLLRKHDVPHVVRHIADPRSAR